MHASKLTLGCGGTKSCEDSEPMPSRDQRERLQLLGGHGSVDDIANRRRYVLALPQPPCAPVPRPPLSSRLVQPHSVQPATGIGFKVIHDPLGPSVRLPDHVNVVAPHVGRQEAPAVS